MTSSDPSGVFASLKDSNGRFRTQSLFWETRHPDYTPIFTVKKQDHEGCISLHRKYLEIADPTEYEVAIRCLGSWDHWLALCKSKWFGTLVEDMRNELKLKMESERYWEMKRILEDPKATNTEKSQATKFLATRYGAKTPTKRGRPSKAEVEAQLRIQTEEDQVIEQEAKRLKIV